MVLPFENVQNVMDGRPAMFSRATLRKVVLINHRESCENDKESLQGAHRSPN